VTRPLPARAAAPAASTAQQQAYIYLQDQIVSGALAGGTRLFADAIAKELGTSRMPVREALRQLDAEGHVTIRPNRGAVVTSRTPEEVIELFEIRAVLEGLAVRSATKIVTPDALDDLELYLQRLKRLEANSALWVERHDEFHDLLCRLSGRARLCAEIQRLRLAIRPYIRLYAKLNARPEIPGFEHRHIVAAMRKADPDRAERAIREHIMVNAEAIAHCLPPPGTRARKAGVVAARSASRASRTAAKSAAAT
jgi:DNA-binding GntR family transcriptional regulator